MNSAGPASRNALLTTLEQKASPAHAALVVVDVQNDFVADGGFFDRIGADVKSAQQSVPNLVRLVDHARAAGVLVVFVRSTYDAQYLSEAMRERNQRREIEMPRCIEGSWGAEFYAVQPLAAESVVVKHRYSAMVNPEFDTLLKRRGIRSLLLTGVATDTCVESTGRDAYFMDYYVSIVADCCGAASASDHLGALERFDRDYGAIVTADAVIEAWQRVPPIPKARVDIAG